MTLRAFGVCFLTLKDQSDIAARGAELRSAERLLEAEELDNLEIKML